MLRVMLDEAPGGTITTEAHDGTALPNLKDRSLTSYVAVGSSLKICVDLGDSATPVNMISLFGMSSDCYGGKFEVISHTDAPEAGDWPATGSFTHEFPIYGSSMYGKIANLGYNSSTENSDRYWLCLLTPGATSAPTLAELCIGLAECPLVPYMWGRSAGQVASVDEQFTIGGIAYRYRRNALTRTDIDVQWDALGDQGLYQVRRWWTETQGGKLPLVVVPDDETDDVFYAYMQTAFPDVERFFQQHECALKFSEILGYETP